MAHIAIIGAGVGGLPSAYELKEALVNGHQITVINNRDHFQFTPSNPWIAVGWRTATQISVPLKPVLDKKKIQLIDENQRTPKYKITYSTGACVAIPPVDTTPVPTVTPTKTGYMIESMSGEIVHNISHELRGEEPEKCGT